mmetsp:Transcript_137811/g.274803  ORF Transcript_137811/g.274803 Transcript_137811/m.274803 type:complete len:82 (-) Transcript_137811:33-278(-)
MLTHVRIRAEAVAATTCREAPALTMLTSISFAMPTDEELGATAATSVHVWLPSVQDSFLFLCLCHCSHGPRPPMANQLQTG